MGMERIGKFAVKEEGDGPSQPAPRAEIKPHIFQGAQRKMLHEVRLQEGEGRKPGKP